MYKYAPSKNQVDLFGLVFALAHIASFSGSFSFFFQPEWWLHLSYNVFDFAVVACAWALLVAPKSSILHRLLFVFFAVSFLLALPAVPNHRWTLLFVHLLVAVSSGRSLQVTARAACLCTAIIYFFAGFYKLNLSYVDPAISCAAIFYQNVRDHYPVLFGGSAVAQVIIWSTVLLELGVSFLLVRRNVSVWTILVISLLHLALAQDHRKFFVNFSLTMWSLHLLCVWDRMSLLSVTMRAVLYRLRMGAILAVPGILGYYVFFEASLEALQLLITMLGVVVYVFAMIPFLWSLQPFTSVLPGRIKAGAMIVLTLVMMNGMAPILGIKNRTAFNMYSNLVLNDRESNHFILGESFDLLGLQKDRLKIIEDHLPRQDLGIFVRTGWELARVDLNRNLRPLSKGSVMVQDASGEKTFLHAAMIRSSDLSWGQFVLEKIAWFRPMGDGADRICVW